MTSTDAFAHFTPEGHVDDVGCPCGPVVNPVAGLTHTLAARDRYRLCGDDCTTDCGACKGAGRPAARVDENPYMLENTPEEFERVSRIAAERHREEADRIAARVGDPAAAVETHGGLAFLDRLASTTTNPALLKAVAEVRAEILAESSR
jgi:hypothetical protein